MRCIATHVIWNCFCYCCLLLDTPPALIIKIYPPQRGVTYGVVLVLHCFYVSFLWLLCFVHFFCLVCERLVCTLRLWLADISISVSWILNKCLFFCAVLFIWTTVWMFPEVLVICHKSALPGQSQHGWHHLVVIETRVNCESLIAQTQALYYGGSLV